MGGTQGTPTPNLQPASDDQINGVVVWIRPAPDRVQVTFTKTDGTSAGAVLEYNHPGYAAVYSLLMASGANRKQITLDLVTSSITGLANTINWVQLNFQ
jgi:hypothetical protein